MCCKSIIVIPKEYYKTQRIEIDEVDEEEIGI